MRTRGVRVGDYEVMGLRSCLRGFQEMALAVHDDYSWWVYGWVPVSDGPSRHHEAPRTFRLVRHALARGTLADGAPAIVQTRHVLWVDRCRDCDPPVDDRTLSQAITVCSVPEASRIRCGIVELPCAPRGCPDVSLVRGVLRAGTEEITIE